MNQVLGTCPVCNGSGRRPAGADPHKKVYSSYDEATDTLACNNCGGQYMYSKPTGKVNLRSDGTPCVHEYKGYNIGRCLTQYVCNHCNSSYQIDSGD